VQALERVWLAITCTGFPNFCLRIYERTGRFIDAPAMVSDLELNVTLC